MVAPRLLLQGRRAEYPRVVLRPDYGDGQDAMLQSGDTMTYQVTLPTAADNAVTP
jgi:hypothetical protein